MRTIKFRGRKPLYNTWEYGSLIIPYEHPKECIIENEGTWYVDANTVGQFTGLRDVNGTEIYEGDILRPCDEKTLSFIKWNDLFAAFVVSLYAADGKTYLGCRSVNDWQPLEVVGNIFDVPKTSNAANLTLQSNEIF